jgi:hypothetical protein
MINLFNFLPNIRETEFTLFLLLFALPLNLLCIQIWLFLTTALENSLQPWRTVQVDLDN